VSLAGAPTAAAITAIAEILREMRTFVLQRRLARFLK
jgi:hypothetical protein